MTRSIAAAALAAALVTAQAATAEAADPDVIRLGGPDRYATAVEVSLHHHPAGAAAVFVASGADFPDGLTGGTAAGLLGVPLLLTRPGDLPAVTRDEILRLGPTQIYLLGGTAAIGQAVEDQLDDIASTTRIAGPDRYATAAAVSLHAFPDPGAVDAIVVTTGADFPDGLTGSAFAASLGGPLLLSRPGDLPAVTRDEILRLGPAQIYLLGGTAAIGQAVFDQLDDIAPTTRIAGADRYATAAAVSELGFPAADAAYMAVGTAFPDALAGAAAAAQAGAPVLLTRTDSLPAVSRAELVRLSPGTAVILGGLSAIGLIPEHRIAHPGLPDLADVDVALVEVAAGFAQPLFVTQRPGDARLFVVEQRGIIWSMDGDGNDRETVLDIQDKVLCCGERGLLGIAFDPADPTRLIVDYTADPGGATTIEEYSFPIADAAADPTPVNTILTVSQDAPNHNGGMIAFGPDGLLYVALGDGGGSDDQFHHGQDPSTLLGAIVRIDLSAAPYAIPPGNPFADGADGAPEVWAYGLRNPWRFSFDGDDLWIADVGQRDWEEVNLVTVADGGANFGWSVLEGTHCFNGPASRCADNDFVDPILEYAIRDLSRCAVTGGYVYRGAQFPDLTGAYFFGDFCTGEIMALRAYKGALVDSRVFPVTASNLSSFGVDGDGRLYVTSFDGGRVLRVVQP